MTVLADYLSAGHSAVDTARRIVLAAHSAVDAPAASFKRDRDPVTETDLAVERAVRDTLHRETPAVGFMGEETGGSLDGLAWVLDPIDGTANFTHGLPLTAVSLALLDHGTPVVGIVDIPTHDVRYAATAGSGATRNGHPIHAGACTELRSAMVALGDYATGSGADERNQVRLRITAVLAARAQRVRMLGSAAIDLAWVANGLLDASVMLANKPWDTAAGVLLVREAGAYVTDLNGNPHTLASTSTVATAPGLTAELLAVLSAHAREADSHGESSG